MDHIARPLRIATAAALLGMSAIVASCTQPGAGASTTPSASEMMEEPSASGGMMEEPSASGGMMEEPSASQ